MDCAIHKLAEALPSVEFYGELQKAFSHFNEGLFENKLPACLITLQRQKNTYGYFSPERFVSSETGECIDEVALNPSWFVVRTVPQTLSTLAHEMVHLWQYHFGDPGRRAYHNREWADRMESIGLMPSNTGKPGGRRVGEKMTHYILEDGPFDRACRELMTREFTLSWLDRFPPQPPSHALAAALTGGSASAAALARVTPVQAENRSHRVKYRCPSCAAQVWGKPGMKLLCGENACKAAVMQPVGT
jgi:predicted SprT family Zn-dependent metalloprotease